MDGDPCTVKLSVRSAVWKAEVGHEEVFGAVAGESEGVGKMGRDVSGQEAYGKGEGWPSSVDS